MPLQATSGAASYDGFGGGVPFTPTYIEDVFSTWLYTGNGSTQTITNGIDLSTKGGLVWLKSRSAAYNHILSDTARGAAYTLNSNDTSAQTNSFGDDVSSFSTTGFSIGGNAQINNNGSTFASWTFRKQPKFFDVVTWTGDGTGDKTISHSLGSTPGFIIAKRTNATGDWWCYHRSLGNNFYIYLNSTSEAFSNPSVNWNPTSNSFVADSFLSLNTNGATYVAYLFAHNAGGFGLTGTDNVISCGSFTTDGSGKVTVDLGYEPQWVMFKRTNGTQNWTILDVMRGMNWDTNTTAELFPNTSGAEGGNSANLYPTPTGFSNQTQSGTSLFDSSTYIYIAIRRGPMRTPTSGTSVFTPVQNSNFTAGVVIAGQPTVDVSWSKQKDAVNPMRIFDRLRGSTTSTNNTLVPSSTAAEVNEPYWAMDQQNGVRITQTLGTFNYINYFFSRAPGFFDVVCYTGDGVSSRAISHNLGVAPELGIFKTRDVSGNSWVVVQKDVCTLANQVLILNSDSALLTTGSYFISGGFDSNTTPTQLTNIGSGSAINGSGNTYVAYLFATVAGVSKVGSYTGSGTTKQIDCGFTGGARFVLIKRTDSTGDWYVWDSARGIVSGNDPYLQLNSTAAEVTNTDWVDTHSPGFELSNASGNNANINGASYIFLAIA